MWKSTIWFLCFLVGRLLEYVLSYLYLGRILSKLLLWIWDERRIKIFWDFQTEEYKSISHFFAFQNTTIFFQFITLFLVISLWFGQVVKKIDVKKYMMLKSMLRMVIFLIKNLIIEATINYVHIMRFIFKSFIGCRWFYFKWGCY